MAIASRVARRVEWFYRVYLARDPFALALTKWYRDRGDETLRLDYPLTRDSIVFDVGGYQGDWAARIVERYDPFVHIFEPAPVFFEPLAARFARNPKVTCHPFGLLDITTTLQLTIDGVGSTLFPRARSGDGAEMVRVVDVAMFLREKRISSVDLMKINIEGGEYPLLRRLIDSGLIGVIRDIQVQFHETYPGARGLREELRAALDRTHRLTYDYFFVWENWRRRAAERL